MLCFSDPLKINKDAQFHWSTPPTVLYNKCISDCVRSKSECTKQGGDLGEVRGTEQASGTKKTMGQDLGILPALDLSVAQTVGQIQGSDQQ